MKYFSYSWVILLESLWWPEQPEDTTWFPSHHTEISLQNETNKPRDLILIIILIVNIITMSVPQAREASSSLQLCR